MSYLNRSSAARPFLLFGFLCIWLYGLYFSLGDNAPQLIWKSNLPIVKQLNSASDIFQSSKQSEANFNKTICNSFRISQNDSLTDSLVSYPPSKFTFIVPTHVQDLEKLRLNPALSRGVYVYFLSRSQLHADRFPKSFHSFYKFIMKPFQYTNGARPGHFDVVVYMERYPDNVWEAFSKQIGRNKTYDWIKIEQDHRIYPTFLKPQHNVQNEIEKTTMVYITADSQSNKYPHRILVHLIGLNVPRYVVDDAAVLDRDDWLRCYGVRWPLEYTLTNTFYTHLLLTHSLIQNYDYLIKIDTDIYWMSQPPSDVIRDMAKGSFMLFHSQITTTTTDCESSHHAMPKLLSVYRKQMFQKLSLQYAQYKCLFQDEHDNFTSISDSINVLLNKLPLSQTYAWYKDPKENQIFYANFMGVWTGWALSEQNRWLIDVLFDNIVDGYIKRRWGDQAIWGRLLGFWFDIPELRTDEKIYDLSHWRDTYFRHKLRK